MLAVEVELLTGRYTATRFNDRTRVEWPPHPARLFSALVATWADANDPDLAERAALEWLERSGDPSIACSAAGERSIVTHYVPDNDTSILRNPTRLDQLYQDGCELRAELAAVAASDGSLPEKLASRLEKHRSKLVDQTAKAVAAASTESPAARATGLALLPDERGRQGRTYPTAVPAEPRVWFGWDAVEDGGHAAALDGLLARVTRLGHSSSLVSCRVVDDMPDPSYLPDPDAGDVALRVPAQGLLRSLEMAFEQHQGEEPRSLPARRAWYRTGQVPATTAPIRPHLAGEWIVLAFADGTDATDERRVRRSRGPRLPLRAALPVCRAVRSALVAHADEPVAEIISGHRRGAPGERTPPTDRPHAAVVPLPFVGHRYADGSLLGVAIVLPRRELLHDDERRAVLRALGRWRESERFALNLPGGRRVRLEQVDEADPPYTLRPQRWRHAARCWASVAPVALDRHPGNLRDRDPRRREKAEAAAERTITAACGHAGLPAPTEVRVSFAAPVVGVPHVRAFPPYRLPERRVSRLTVHAYLEFAEKVSGPVLLGAGRHYGYGLFMPVSDGARYE